MINLDQLYVDFKQRYEHTYIRTQFPQSPTKDVFFVESVKQGEKYPILCLRNDKVGAVQLNYDSESKILFDAPPLGYFWFDHKVALLYRRLSTRQWKRGICAGNSVITNGYMNHLWIINVPLSLVTLEAAYQHQHATFETAIDLLSSIKALSIPLSDHLAIGLSPLADGLLIVWYEDTPIAKYHLTACRLHLFEKHFEQEVTDYFRKTNTYVQII